MSTHFHNELRKEFQLERLILFSDAVFAIAITLLVIEIKIPEIPDEQLTDKKLLSALGQLIPKFVGFLISFLIIGQYWTVHHRMFGYVINFTGRLIWLNILFLLAIALMPFSTAFYSEYATKKVFSPVIFYTANIGLLGIVNFYMWRYIRNPKHKLSENLSPVIASYFSIRALAVLVIFIIFSFVYLADPMIAVWIPLTIPLLLRIIYLIMRKKINASKKP